MVTDVCLIYHHEDGPYKVSVLGHYSVVVEDMVVMTSSLSSSVTIVLCGLAYLCHVIEIKVNKR